MRKLKTKNTYFEWDYFNDRPYPNAASENFLKHGDYEYRHQGTKISDAVKKDFTAGINIIGTSYYKPYAHHKKRDDELYLIVEMDEVLLGVYVGLINVNNQKDHKGEVHHVQAVKLIKSNAKFLNDRIVALHSKVVDAIENQQQLIEEERARTPSPLLVQQEELPDMGFYSCMSTSLIEGSEDFDITNEAELLNKLNAEDDTGSALLYEFKFKGSAIIYANTKIKRLTREVCINSILALEGLNNKVYINLLSECLNIKYDEGIALLGDRLLEHKVILPLKTCLAQMNNLTNQWYYNTSFTPILVSVWLMTADSISEIDQIKFINQLLKMPLSMLSDHNRQCINSVIIALIKSNNEQRLECRSDSNHETYYRYLSQHLSSQNELATLVKEYFNTVDYQLCPIVRNPFVLNDIPVNQPTSNSNKKKKKKKKKKKVKTYEVDLAKINELLVQSNTQYNERTDDLKSFARQKARSIISIFLLLGKNEQIKSTVSDQVKKNLMFIIALCDALILTELYQNGEEDEIKNEIKSLIEALSYIGINDDERLTPISATVIFILGAYARDGYMDKKSFDPYKDRESELLGFSQDGSYFHGMLSYFSNKDQVTFNETMVHYDLDNQAWNSQETSCIYDENIKNAIMLELPTDIFANDQWHQYIKLMEELLHNQMVKFFAPSFLQDMEADVHAVNYYLGNYAAQQCLDNHNASYSMTCISAFDHLLQDEIALSDQMFTSVVETFISVLKLYPINDHRKLVRIISHITNAPIGRCKNLGVDVMSWIYITSLTFSIESKPNAKKYYFPENVRNMLLRLMTLKGWEEYYDDDINLMYHLYYIISISSDPDYQYELKCAKIESVIEKLLSILEGDISDVVNNVNAAMGSKDKICELLLNKSWLQLPGLSPFFLAVIEGNTSQVKHLLQNGYSIDDETFHGINAYNLAVLYEQLDVIKLLEVNQDVLFMGNNAKCSMIKLLSKPTFFIRVFKEHEYFRETLLTEQSFIKLLEVIIDLCSYHNNEDRFWRGVVGRPVIELFETYSYELPRCSQVVEFMHKLFKHGSIEMIRAFLTRQKNFLRVSTSDNYYPLHSLSSFASYESIVNVIVCLSTQFALTRSQIQLEITASDAADEVILDVLHNNNDCGLYKQFLPFFEINRFKEQWQTLAYNLVNRCELEKLIELNDDVGLEAIFGSDFHELLSDAINCDYIEIADYLVELKLCPSAQLATKIKYCILHDYTGFVQALSYGLPRGENDTHLWRELLNYALGSLNDTAVKILWRIIPKVLISRFDSVEQYVDNEPTIQPEGSDAFIDAGSIAETLIDNNKPCCDEQPKHCT